jgi:hypothetical protein
MYFLLKPQDEAADKYIKWLEAVGKFGIVSLDDDLWKEEGAQM